MVNRVVLASLVVTASAAMGLASSLSPAPLPVVASPAGLAAAPLPVLQEPPCQGPSDERPGCPHDPDPWICTHAGKGKTHACACHTICATDEESGETSMSESNDCKRWCKRSQCDCDPEPECKSPKG